MGGWGGGRGVGGGGGARLGSPEGRAVRTLIGGNGGAARESAGGLGGKAGWGVRACCTAHWLGPGFVAA